MKYSQLEPCKFSLVALMMYREGELKSDCHCLNVCHYSVIGFTHADTGEQELVQPQVHLVGDIANEVRVEVTLEADVDEVVGRCTASVALRLHSDAHGCLLEETFGDESVGTRVEVCRLVSELLLIAAFQNHCRKELRYSDQAVHGEALGLANQESAL